MAAPQPGQPPSRSKSGPAAEPVGPMAAPVGPAAAPVGPVGPVGAVGPTRSPGGVSDSGGMAPAWPVVAEPAVMDGAAVATGVVVDGPAVADGATAVDGAAPVVPPPPPAPPFPPSPGPLPPPPPAPPLVRRPGWGLYRPNRSRSRRERRPRGPRVVQGRRSRRVVRRIDTWTVLKLSFLFYLCVLMVVLIAGILLWNIAAAVGSITSVEKFIRSLFDLTTFKLHPGVILESSVAGGIVLVLLATGANVLAALLYNLISDVVGGVQVIVLEEQESVPPG